MRRSMVVLVVAVLLGGLAASSLDAQVRRTKVRRVTTGPDADGDGVPDSLDRCPNTPPGVRVGNDGCPLRLVLPGQSVPAAPAAAPGAAPPVAPTGAAGAPAAAAANGAARQGVAPQAEVHPGSAFSSGLAIQPYGGTTDVARHAYLRRFTQMLDSAIVTLVDVFRNTSGTPVAGAESPTSLSQRERDRWARCRDLHFDLQSYVSAFHDLMENLPPGAGIERAAGQLDSSLTAIQATSECDNIASMIEAPARWTPWGAQYVSAAHHFYADWYAQVRDADDHNRSFIVAFNQSRQPAARLPVPPALPRTPPYVGATPR